MNKIFHVVIALIVSQVGFSQKIKYKDIFAQIEAKNYEAIGPVLKQYVFNPKNSDHANSHLQLAYHYERQLLAADILKDTATVYGWADSAYIYFVKARTLITEKELKKNDEYYQAFYRRDLRSGEFGIKISDVHLEIEDKSKSSKSRGENILEVNKNLTKANVAYNEAVEIFQKLHGEYDDYTLFLMKSTRDTKDDLKEIQRKMRASKRAISNMRRSLSLIENPGFGPEFTYAEVTEFPQRNVEKVDFYNGEFDKWELGDWADEVHDKIEKDVEPLKADIIAYDKELTDYKSNLFSGGTSINEPLSFKENIMNEINNYDENSILKDIVDIKIQDINILKVYAPTLNARAADKEDIDYQLLIADSLVVKFRELGETVDKLSQRDLDKEYEKYSFFFDSRMKGKSGLKDFIEEKKREATEQSEYWTSQSAFWLETSNWALMEFGSLPLFTMDSAVAYPNDSLQYLTLSRTRDDSLNIYPIGFEFGPKLKGYVANVAKNRDGIWYLKLDVGRMTPGDTVINTVAKFVPSSPEKLSFYFYAPTSTRDNFIIFSIDKTGSQAWRNSMQLESEPYEVRFSENVSETIIYMDNPDDPEVQDLKYFVIDRSGKLRN